jgi:predicted ATPase
MCDLHVHSPASPDIRCGARFILLSKEEQILLERVSESLASQPLLYEQKVLLAFPVSRYFQLLVEHRDKLAEKENISTGEDWAYVAITDHNVCNFACALSSHAWEQRDAFRVVVLPGIELDVSFPVSEDKKTEAHIILVFSPQTQSDDIRVAIRDLTKNNWSFGQIAEVDSLPEFICGLRKHQDYPAIAIAAHVSSGKGVQAAAKRTREIVTFTAVDVAIARTAAELEHNLESDREDLEIRLEQLKKERETGAKQISVEVLKLLGSCGFDGLQVSCKQDETHYRRLHRFNPGYGRAVPIVASDAHRLAEIFICEDNIPYLKMPTQSKSISPKQILSHIRHALRYGETRFSYSSPGHVTRWISGIEITPDSTDASKFWPFAIDGTGRNSFVLPLSRNLNCFVGGRGSGKSAAIEAISFVTKPTDFLEKYRKPDDVLDDWYKRARATLAGCQVRLVWQSPGSTTELPKGALFSLRYFNSCGEHGPVQHSNLDDKEMLGSSLVSEPVQLFRMRDIEDAVEPNLLRKLFDELVGEEIPILEKNITELLDKLAKQRGEIVAIAWKIMELTQDNTPLREYVRRRITYEAVNRREVQQSYTHLDEASVAEAIIQDTKKKWDGAVAEFDIDGKKTILTVILNVLSKKIKDKNDKLRPYCDGIAKLFDKGEEGLSPIDRFENAFTQVKQELDNLKLIIQLAFEEVQSQHKNAREVLVKQGLPAGAKDREAKKQNYEKAEEDLTVYRELVIQWQDSLKERNILFESLVEKCKERTKLRTNTASRLVIQLARDLDPSILTIGINVYPMEDRAIFKDWLADNIGPCIPRYKDTRISAILDKNIMPKEVCDSLLGEVVESASVFIVNKGKASDGEVDKELSDDIINKCSGKIRLDAEHTIMKDKPSEEFINTLPLEIREGLWTFPKTDPKSSSLIVDAVLVLDEVIFDDRPEILLNDRPQEAGSVLRPINELSAGQRCSAILPILLLNGQNPLIIDQPEDNLDNRLIRQVIVNILASIKLRRQVIVATHNPNLPVLGDVEQAIILRAIGEKQCRLESTGDLDSPDTVAHLTEIMEGGREAFQYRQSIYQEYWTGPIV